jgi:hypothetical protein
MANDIAMQQKLEYCAGQRLCAQIELEGMLADNKTREGGGNSPAYGKDAFDAIMRDYPTITHNGFFGYIND